MSGQPDLRARGAQRVSIIINPHLPISQQTRILAGTRGLAINALVVNRMRGINASTASIELVDTGTGTHRQIAWGQRIRIMFGSVVVFGGTISVLVKDIAGAAGVRVSMECASLDHYIYNKQVHGTPNYASTDTKTVAATLIGAMAVEWLSHDISGTSGITTPSPFTLASGDTVGEVMEKLTALDGHEFWVEDDPEADYPVVHYEVPSANAVQRTIKEEDLLSEAPWEVGVTPPVTVARVTSSGGNTHDTNAASRLYEDYAADGTANLRIIDNSAFNASGGTCRVGKEELTYSGKGSDATSDYLIITARGVNGTLSAWHQPDAIIVGEAAQTYGLWIDERPKPNLVDAAKMATQMLALGATPGERLTLPLREFDRNLTPYAPVTVKRPRLDIDADYDVVSVVHEMTLSGDIRTTAVCGSVPYSIARSLEHLRKAT